MYGPYLTDEETEDHSLSDMSTQQESSQHFNDLTPEVCALNRWVTLQRPEAGRLLAHISRINLGMEVSCLAWSWCVAKPWN